jgi:hypothetical protein
VEWGGAASSTGLCEVTLGCTAALCSMCMFTGPRSWGGVYGWVVVRHWSDTQRGGVSRQRSTSCTHSPDTRISSTPSPAHIRRWRPWEDTRKACPWLPRQLSEHLPTTCCCLLHTYISAGVETLGGKYELHDLVQLDTHTAGIIVGINNDTARVLTNQSTLQKNEFRMCRVRDTLGCCHDTDVHCTVLYCTVLHCRVVHCGGRAGPVSRVLHFGGLYCSALHCTVKQTLDCNVLQCGALDCNVLHFRALLFGVVQLVVLQGLPFCASCKRCL